MLLPCLTLSTVIVICLLGWLVDPVFVFLFALFVLIDGAVWLCDD